MTVVLSLVCADGVVIAADSQITDSDRGMSYPGQKLHPLGPNAAWGGSGARSVMTDLERLFADSYGAILESEDIGRALQERVMPVLEHHYEHFIEEVPGEKSEGGPSAYVLAAGYTDGEPWIIEINPQAMVSRYESIGFHAIGSGAPMAQQAGALLAHFRMNSRSVAYGALVALRVLDALAQSAPNVGGELDVCQITDEGAHHLDADEMEELREHLVRWKEMEHKALDKLFT